MKDLFGTFDREMVQWGTWMTLGSPIIAELCAELEFDWLLLDLEHGTAGEASVLPVLQAVRGTRTAVIVRVGAPEPSQIARLLDWGAHGIMVPHVSTAEDAGACVSAIRYPPHGRRGFSRSARQFGYGLRPPVSPSDFPQPIFLAQIENLEGVRNAPLIAEVDGVDGLFIGPSDLRLDLSCHPDDSAIDFDSAVDAVICAAQTANKAVGILLRDISELERNVQSGITLIAIDSDLAIIRTGYQAIRRLLNAHKGSRELNFEDINLKNGEDNPE